jgi:chitin synthase
MGCVAYNIIVFLSMLAVTALILTKFFMAVAFSWFISRKLDRMKKDQDEGLDDGQVMKQEVPEIVTQSIQATLGVPSVLGMSSKAKTSSSRPFVFLMVTCYSESEASIKGTLDSLAATDYPDHRKLLFIVADGLVTGSGNWASTPEIILKMLNVDESMGDPKPYAYSAVSEGDAGINMAKVFVGVYGYEGRPIPAVLVVKCGLPSEESSRKPGNRGKRDSQMILMNFLQRVIFNESMTGLDYDLFNKIYWLMGVPPDYFDIVLMVDADTRVAVDSLGRMVNAMMRDPKVIGLCGETKIANKGQSWVTAIQVFEYYISHHLGKAFESVFGGVTCLPGCFSMYRIKVAKNGQWVPILVSPAVTEEYSQKTVNTLHKKNLLLLGEDRFLTTLMIRTFPKRKMIFVPQAYCKTIVPHEFKVLLSQRRRWINSTIHNLMELVLVNDLCGTFCFSMQFVVLMELIGNVVLPAAIVFTGVLLATAFVNPLNAILPLVLLVLVLGLPAVLIVITTKNLVYLLWMVIYLLALPVWNFILPLYAYWHFDDFTWGHTRKLSDKEDDKEMDEKEAVNRDEPFDVQMKTWIAWTRYYLKHYNEKEAKEIE